MDKMDIFGEEDLITRLGKAEIYPTALGGAMPKLTVELDNNLYMIKYDNPNNKATVSEYIASKLAKALNLECQEVFLGYRNNRRCCFVKLFNGALHPYIEIDSDSLGSDIEHFSDLEYNLPNIISVIKSYKNANESVEYRLNKFIMMCYFDTLIGNFDRHWGNWGFLLDGVHNRVSPIYDNGSSLFPSRNIEVLEANKDNKQFLLDGVFKFPTSEIRNISDNSKMLYSELIRQLIDNFGLDLLKDFCNRFEKVDLNNLFEDKYLKPFLEPIEVNFLKCILILRFKLLLQNNLKEVIK